MNPLPLPVLNSSVIALVTSKSKGDYSCLITLIHNLYRGSSLCHNTSKEILGKLVVDPDKTALGSDIYVDVNLINKFFETPQLSAGPIELVSL